MPHPTPGLCPRADLGEGRQPREGTPSTTTRNRLVASQSGWGHPMPQGSPQRTLQTSEVIGVCPSPRVFVGSGSHQKATQICKSSPRKGKHLTDKAHHSAQRRGITRTPRSTGPETHPLRNPTGSRDAHSSTAATTPNKTAKSLRDSTKEDHETDNGSDGVDDEAIAFWDATCAAMPPLSPTTIAAIAVIVRHIDRRRAQR